MVYRPAGHRPTLRSTPVDRSFVEERLCPICSAGPCLCEPIHLRLGDLATDRPQLIIHGGKGNNDRITLVAPRPRPRWKPALPQTYPGYIGSRLSMAPPAPHTVCTSPFTKPRLPQA